jgi:hypothetical protein
MAIWARDLITKQHCSLELGRLVGKCEKALLGRFYGK